MSTITGIEESRGMVSIYADGTLALKLRRAHFAQCPLHEGDAFDPDDYTGRVAALQFRDAYEAALSCLDRSDRTEKQLSDALRRRGYVAPVIEAVIQRLRENRLLDDARYASRLAELQSGKPVGVYAFKRKLRARGVSEADAEAALEAFDDAQQQSACLEAAQRLYRKYEALPVREGRAKLSQALARRGFGWDAVEGVVDQLFSD